MLSGYSSSGRQATDLGPPPRGPAPGAETFFFLVGACETQDEIDRLWADCFGENPV